MDSSSRSCLFNVARFQTTTKMPLRKMEHRRRRALLARKALGRHAHGTRNGMLQGGCSQCTRASGALDVEGEVDATSNRENVTCWKMESLSAIFHPVWQTIYYNVGEPFRHFCRFLVVVPRGSCKVGKLARLVCVKASGIANAFDVLIDADAWSEQVRVLPTSGSCCTLWLLLSSAANFDRRVLQMTRAFPMRLLWLARAQPSTLQRRRVADELINTSADFLRTPL